MTNEQDWVWRILDDVTALCRESGWPTPEKGYKLDGGWDLALADLKRYIGYAQQSLEQVTSERDALKAEIDAVIKRLGDPDETETLMQVAEDLHWCGDQGWNHAGLEMEKLQKMERRAKQAEAERDAMAEENDKLRYVLAKSPADCLYCRLPQARMGECRHGFPGCARADDLLSWKGE